MWLRMYCLQRARLVPLLGMGLQLYCLNRASLVLVLGMQLQNLMYCLNRGLLVPLLGMVALNVLPKLRPFGASFGHGGFKCIV